MFERSPNLEKQQTCPRRTFWVISTWKVFLEDFKKSVANPAKLCCAALVFGWLVPGTLCETFQAYIGRILTHTDQIRSPGGFTSRTFPLLACLKKNTSESQIHQNMLPNMYQYNKSTKETRPSNISNTYIYI